MRKSTQNIVGVLSLGILATSWSIGQAAETGLVLENVALPSSSPNPPITEGPATAPESNPSPSSSQNSKPAPAVAKKVSKTGAAITYKVQGYTYQVQLKVTKDGSTISAISPLIAEATKFGKTDFTVAFPYLEQMALAASSANFANVTGATFTSEAYKEALGSALAKF